MKFYKIHFRTTIQLNQQQQKLPNNVKISTTKKANYLEVDFFFFKQPVCPRKNCKLQPILTE